jgi:hypothetical protein
MASFDVEHRVVPPGQPDPHADMRSATPGYFPATGITLKRGRLPLMQTASALLFGVAPHDPKVYAGSAAALVTLIVAVSAIAARRAASIDPLRALRY